MSGTTLAGSQDALDDLIVSSYHDPLAFVLGAYPWGEVGGPLEHEAGPDVWQRDFLTRLGEAVTERAFDGHAPVAPVRMAVSSGHGIGKSTLVAWLVDWIMSTRPQCRGTLTANTFTQLETKTWAALHDWHAKCLTADRFTITTARMYHAAHKDTWFCAPQSSKEENSEAFAGQHEKRSTSFYIFDEASAIPDEIWRVAEGGLTDGEAMLFAFGNPTRSQGSFHAACFGVMRKRWDSVAIDSRECRFTNKTQIKEWEDDYGENSDFFRVRIKGLPPLTGDLQFIDTQRVFAAEARVADVLSDEPLIAGVDVSGGGSSWTVCRFRRGLDGRSIAPIRLTGEQTRERQNVVNVLAERLRQTDPRERISAMFIDSAFGAAIVERLHALGFQQVHEVNFGAKSPDPHQLNQRAYQWNKLKDWLRNGAIPKDDRHLQTDLTGPGFHINKKGQLVLESKENMVKRKVASPDDGDALSLTFAQPVALPQVVKPAPYRPRGVWS